ncbi:MAG: PDZ domain-containing protein, partial [Verrucomicrobiales bacterium]|nr:PDZ domain-containing protein [Verrucomicrobiales bacterium]
VRGVMPESPAAAAGLRDGDLITQVNGKSLAAVPLKQTVDTIRGFTATSLQLTILRAGETNPIFVTIQRASFKSLKVSP